MSTIRFISPLLPSMFVREARLQAIFRDPSAEELNAPEPHGTAARRPTESSLHFLYDGGRMGTSRVRTALTITAAFAAMLAVPAGGRAQVRVPPTLSCASPASRVQTLSGN